MGAAIRINGGTHSVDMCFDSTGARTPVRLVTGPRLMLLLTPSLAARLSGIIQHALNAKHAKMVVVPTAAGGLNRGLSVNNSLLRS